MKENVHRGAHTVLWPASCLLLR